MHLLLIDPFESRAEVALLQMPIETNPAVIEHIFQSLNPEWKASAIKQVPGEQMRADRWKLLVACSDKRLIPQGFVLPEMGPERQDVNVKVFVRGKKADFEGRDNLPNRQNSHILKPTASVFEPLSSTDPSSPTAPTVPTAPATHASPVHARQGILSSSPWGPVRHTCARPRWSRLRGGRGRGAIK